ncbi:MAG TPA: flagellar biosynthetic protein FliO [Alphaproteobacteria bacterium]|nr:flagellar biosynthetic protein FliO [Alphaproteobacteria bacterium]HNS44982.1 flagellar biosynthetic protein FliO [Alphaproteobacteria bacterium]
MESTEILRFLASLIFVLALMGGLWILLRKLGLNGPSMMTPVAKRRMKVVEVLPLDPRRKAILLRRDDTDHLVILGPSGETVVETQIPAKADEDDKKTV